MEIYRKQINPTINDLPTEVLTQIFDFLPLPDLLNTTLVCTHFNDVFSASWRLLNKFTVVFTPDKIHRQWIGTRKYPDVTVSPFAFDAFLPVLMAFAGEITSLRCGDFERTKVRDFRELLMATGKLRNLKLVLTNDSEIGEKSVIEMEPKVKLNLHSLDLTALAEYLPLFSECQVKKLRIRVPYVHHRKRMKLLKNFIVNQRNLEDLEVTTVVDGLFDDDQVNCRLKRLSLKLPKEGEVEKVLKFIKLHSQTLKHLSIDSFYVLDSLQNFPNLSSLDLNTNQVLKLPDSTFEAITMLSVTQFTSEVAEKFPNVKHLKIHQTNRSDDIDKLRHIETLELHGESHQELSIPRVKVLTYRCFGHQLHSRPFKFETQNLEELHAEVYCENIKWLKEFIDEGFDEKLKVMKVTYYESERRSQLWRMQMRIE